MSVVISPEGIVAGTAPAPLALENDAVVEDMQAQIEGAALITVPFPSSADGRGFSLAGKLRDMGYTGRLRATGALIPDQFAFALRCGFDEVEISDEQAQRQPVTQWLELLKTTPEGYSTAWKR